MSGTWKASHFYGFTDVTFPVYTAESPKPQVESWGNWKQGDSSTPASPSHPRVKDSCDEADWLTYGF